MLQITPRRLFLTDADEKQTGPPDFPGETNMSKTVKKKKTLRFPSSGDGKLIYWFKQQLYHGKTIKKEI